MVADDVTMQIGEASAVMILMCFACNNPGPSRLGLSNRYCITNKGVLQTHVLMLQWRCPFLPWYHEDSKVIYVSNCSFICDVVYEAVYFLKMILLSYGHITYHKCNYNFLTWLGLWNHMRYLISCKGVCLDTIFNIIYAHKINNNIFRVPNSESNPPPEKCLLLVLLLPHPMNYSWCPYYRRYYYRYVSVRCNA